MGFNYAASAETALRLIRNFGSVASVRRYVGDFDPIAGTTTEEFASTEATLVTVPSGSSLASFDDQFIGALTAGRARIFLIAASGLEFAPKAGDCVLYESELWEIGGTPAKGGVMPLSPAGTPVIYTVGTMSSGRDPNDGLEVPVVPDQQDIVIVNRIEEAFIISDELPVDADGAADGTIWIYDNPET